jgi:phage terminase large subunit-like protein
MSTVQLTDRALDLVASLVLEDGRRWGEAAERWQWQDAAAVLDVQSSSPYHFLTRSRGGSKTGDLAAVAIAVMVVQAPLGARLYALAADRDQGRLLLDSIEGFIRRTPELGNLFDMTAFRVTGRETGVRLEVLSADAASAWGLRPYFTVIDELAQWPETPESKRLFEAIRTAAGKVNGRMVILTTAGDPTHFAHELREHALADPLWRVHEVPGPVPWISPERLAEQRRGLPESSFRRLHLNQWVEAEDRLTTLEGLKACATLSGPVPFQPGLEYVIGLDIGVTHDRTAVAVCHAEPYTRREDEREFSDWRVIVDRVQAWQGSRDEPVLLAEVRAWVEAAVRSYGWATVITDPYQAISMAQELRQLGVRVEEFTFNAASNGRLATALHLLLRNRALALPNDPGLLAELARVRLRETQPGVLRLDHDPGDHDDRAIAIALAAVRLLERPASAGPQIRVIGGGPSASTVRAAHRIASRIRGY